MVAVAAQNGTTNGTARTGQIYELLPRVAAEVGPVAKSRRNDGQKYDFRGIEDVMNAVSPVFARHGVIVVPEVRSVDRQQFASKNGGLMWSVCLTVAYRFCAPDGSTVEAVVIGEGMDTGDKASNKAMSAAYKYAAGQVLSIPFAAIDSEQDSPEPHDPPASTEDIAALEDLMDEYAPRGEGDNGRKWLDWLAKQGVKDLGDLTRGRCAELRELVQQKIRRQRSGR